MLVATERIAVYPPPSSLFEGQEIVTVEKGVVLIRVLCSVQMKVRGLRPAQVLTKEGP